MVKLFTSAEVRAIALESRPRARAALLEFARRLDDEQDPTKFGNARAQKRIAELIKERNNALVVVLRGVLDSLDDVLRDETSTVRLRVRAKIVAAASKENPLANVG